MPHKPSYAMYLGGCRCDGCRAAAIDAYKVRRKKEKESVALAQRTRTAHGTERSYNLGCRCEKCEVAQEVREEVLRRRETRRERDEWVNRLSFQNTEPVPTESEPEEEELSDEELEEIDTRRAMAEEQELHFENIL